MPHSPKPPTESVAPSGMSATASAADETTLSMTRSHPGSPTVCRRVSTDWPRVRLHVVTGKGGTGKSTVAAALALALASHGKHVLLCEVEGRQGIARMFDVDPLPYEERRLATGLARRRASPPGPCTRCTSTPRRRCWSTSPCTTSSAAPAGPWTGSGSSSSRPPSRPASATCC